MYFFSGTKYGHCSFQQGVSKLTKKVYRVFIISVSAIIRNITQHCNGEPTQTLHAKEEKIQTNNHMNYSLKTYE